MVKSHLKKVPQSARLSAGGCNCSLGNKWFHPESTKLGNYMFN